MEIIDYLLARKKAGGGSDVTIEQLSVTENGTYSEQGIAYSPVVVNVPAPANSYQLKNLPSGTVSTIDDGTTLPMPSLKVGIEPAQDLHGYDHPWVGGAGKNKCNAQNPIVLSQAGNIGDQPCAIPAGTYTFSWTSSADTAILLTLQNGSTQIGTFASLTAIQGRGDLTFTITENATSLKCYFNAATTVSDIQVESGSTTTSYEPYSNICPISGWTAANVTRTGKNLFDQSSFEWEYSESQIKYVTMPIPNGTYTFSTNMPDRDTNIRDVFVFAGQVESGASSPINGVSIISPRTITVTDGHYTIASRYGSIVDDYDWQLEEGSTVTTYEPYNSATYTIQFTDGDNPLTVYGGTLDVTSGELVVDRASVDLGNIDWSSIDSYDGKNRFLSSVITNMKSMITRTMDIMCSCYETGTGIEPYVNYRIYNGASVPQLVIVTSNYSDATTLKTSLSGQTAVYELATPVTYHLTPTQVRTLVGNNNIWADTGDIIEGSYFKSLS